MAELGPLVFGDIADTGRPLAIAIHGFPDTPYTWRHLGPDLAERGYRVVAPWLPGYEARPPGRSAWRRMSAVRESPPRVSRRRTRGPHRSRLGRQAAYGAVASNPDGFARYVAFAVPRSPRGPINVSYAQLERSCISGSFSRWGSPRWL